ncbi:Rha family transcriptional regulator [Rhodopseudomonas parapalustris]
MNDLTIIKHNNINVTDSRDVADITGKRHDHLIRDIKGYIDIMKNNAPKVGEVKTNGKFRSLDFFIPNTYIDSKGEERPNYLLTRKGCDMVANKMTGEKGVLFTAAYVTKFEEMEKQQLIEKSLKESTQQKQMQSPEDKKKLADARYNNSLARKANILLKLADKAELSKEYKQVLYSHATAIVAGKPLLPLPEAIQKTYSATELGEILGITSNKVGKLTNKHNLKTEQYGKLFHDKSKYSSKEVESFRYFESVIPVLKEILNLN